MAQAWGSGRAHSRGKVAARVMGRRAMYGIRQRENRYADAEPKSLNTGRFFFSSRRRHRELQGDWVPDVCSSDLEHAAAISGLAVGAFRSAAHLRGYWH